MNELLDIIDPEKKKIKTNLLNLSFLIFLWQSIAEKSEIDIHDAD